MVLNQKVRSLEQIDCYQPSHELKQSIEYAIEENILSVQPFLCIIHQNTIRTNTVFCTKPFPEFKSNYSNYGLYTFPTLVATLSDLDGYYFSRHSGGFKQTMENTKLLFHKLLYIWYRICLQKLQIHFACHTFHSIELLLILFSIQIECSRRGFILGQKLTEADQEKETINKGCKHDKIIERGDENFYVNYSNNGVQLRFQQISIK